MLTMAKFEVRPNMQEQKAFVIEAESFHTEGGHLVFYNLHENEESKFKQRKNVSSFGPGAWKMVVKVESDGP